MEIQLNDYHKKVNALKMASMAYWRASAFAGGVLKLNSSACGNSGLQGSPNCQAKRLG